MVDEFSTDTLKPAKSIVSYYINLLAYFGLSIWLLVPDENSHLGDHVVILSLDHMNVHAIKRSNEISRSREKACRLTYTTTYSSATNGRNTKK